MIWLVYVQDREVGEVEAPDRDIARARAWARYGPVVTSVVSRVEAGIQREEQAALDRNKRIKRVDYDEE